MVVTTEGRFVMILVVTVALIGCRFDRARMHMKRKRWFELWHYGFSLFCTLSQNVSNYGVGWTFVTREVKFHLVFL
jgi:hypothetical protein